MIRDFLLILQWWSVLFSIGLIALPICIRLFDKFFDGGYVFSKVIGALIVSYAIYLLATVRILPFTTFSIYLLILVFFVVNLNIVMRNKTLIPLIKNKLRIFIFEEFLFLIALCFWAYIRAHEPSIHGLEKYMDFGFVNSLLRSTYFPPKDMWFTPFPINYYYFGHLVTAVLTKISFLPSFITYNLMLATIFALSITGSFSIGANLLKKTSSKRVTPYLGGILTAILVSLSGNLQIIYSFFTPYRPDNPVPPWQLIFSPSTYPNSYWYPNATRFIPFTIHEFPIYSFVVSDLHGHVLDIPMVLISIALAYNIFLTKKVGKDFILFFSFILAVMYMTNTWDAIIYFGLLAFCIILLSFYKLEFRKTKNRKQNFSFKRIKNFNELFIDASRKLVLIIGGSVLFSLPFSIFFKPFVSGIGVICAPTFLTKMQRIGPFLFEENHCQRSEWWELLILYGFFYFFALVFITFISKREVKKFSQDGFVLVLIALSTALIIVPEFIYVKDIYPAHYRANTMFKLVYEVFIMLSIMSSYAIIRVLNSTKRVLLLIIFVPLISLVISYSYFAISSYYTNLAVYHGLDGIAYLKNLHPEDYYAINWINKNIKGQPVILEAQGDSYTDYARISANTGLPTVLGWTVHEWLWRGSYGVPAPRIEEVKTIYKTEDLNLTKALLRKYDVKYVYIGTLEEEKYPNLDEKKFNKLGQVIYENDGAKIYKLPQF